MGRAQWAGRVGVSNRRGHQGYIQWRYSAKCGAMFVGAGRQGARADAQTADALCQKAGGRRYGQQRNEWRPVASHRAPTPRTHPTTPTFPRTGLMKAACRPFSDPPTRQPEICPSARSARGRFVLSPPQQTRRTPANDRQFTKMYTHQTTQTKPKAQHATHTHATETRTNAGPRGMSEALRQCRQRNMI